MPIGNSTTAESPASGYILRYGKEGKAVRKALTTGFLSAQNRRPGGGPAPGMCAEWPIMGCGLPGTTVVWIHFNDAAVVNAGLISFGTLVILSSAFCTSGRITTYLLISACARA